MWLRQQPRRPGGCGQEGDLGPSETRGTGLGRGGWGGPGGLVWDLACAEVFMHVMGLCFLADLQAGRTNHHHLGGLWVQTLTQAGDRPALFRGSLS